MRLSYSKLSTFWDCGFRYRLQYLEKLPGKPKPHLRFGKSLHQALHQFYTFPGTGKPDREYLLDAYRAAWPRQNEGSRRFREQGLQLLERFYDINIATYQRPYWVEEPFRVPIGGHRFVGRFDRVDHLGGKRFEVLDYKAERRVPTQTEVDEDLQLTLYALAFAKLTGDIPSLVMYHLRTNTPITTTRTQACLTIAERQVGDAAERMLAGEALEPRRGQECRWCDFRRYCPLQREDPEPIPRRQQPQLELPFPKRPPFAPVEERMDAQTR